MAGLAYQGPWQVAANVPDLKKNNLHQDGWLWLAQTVNPLVGETAPAGLTGITGKKIYQNDFISWDGAAAAFTHERRAFVGATRQCLSACSPAPPVSQLNWGWQLVP